MWIRDRADTVKPRLELAEAVCERIMVIDETEKSPVSYTHLPREILSDFTRPRPGAQFVWKGTMNTVSWDGRRKSAAGTVDQQAGN